MAVSISTAVLAAVVVIVLLRTGYVRLWPALACALFGFTLAATGAAPAINSALTSIAGAISKF